MDSDGDGTGDFKGLTRRLDYLHGLGSSRSLPIAMTATTCPIITASIRVMARSAILSNSPMERSNAAYVCSSPFSPIAAHRLHFATHALAAERLTDKHQQQEDSKHGVHQCSFGAPAGQEYESGGGGAHVYCWP